MERCDAPTRDRLRTKLRKLEADPFDPQHSKPLRGRKEWRSARVGDLRILFVVDGVTVVVSSIDSRGQVYKHSS